MIECLFIYCWSNGFRACGADGHLLDRRCNAARTVQSPERHHLHFLLHSLPVRSYPSCLCKHNPGGNGLFDRIHIFCGHKMRHILFPVLSQFFVRCGFHLVCVPYFRFSKNLLPRWLYIYILARKNEQSNRKSMNIL